MTEIFGNIKGVKDVLLNELKTLYLMPVPFGQLISKDVALKLATVSAQINKEISLYITRAGQITNIAIGNVDSVSLPEALGRRGKGRLSGIRCLHTHPGGNSALSGVDFSALKNNRFDAMLTIGVDANNLQRSVISMGVITGNDENMQLKCDEYGPLTLEQAENFYFPNFITTIERVLAKFTDGGNENRVKKERAILVSLEWGVNKTSWSAEDSLEELKQLADTAGAEVVAKFFQKRSKPDAAFFIGSGKVGELALFCQQEDVDLCIFDDELSPAQQRNIEQSMGVRILDRTGLILDIFAQRARTSEGKMQVELAQLQYTLPRIMGQGLSLSRLGGGIGTRGPGETKLEVDRRRIRDRIAFIKESIEKMKAVRTLHRDKRNKGRVPAVSLVGYTNAGKSTLLNILTDSEIYAQDQLFATLDPTTRQLELPDKQEAVLTDTVGFIQRLPHQLVMAFRSTLEDVSQADLLLHVIDISHPLYKEQSEAVYTVLQEIGAIEKSIITVYNKIDKLPEGSALAERLGKVDNSVCVSAKLGIGLDKLRELIAENLNMKTIETTLLFPYAQAGTAAQFHDLGTVLQQEYTEEGVKLRVRLEPVMIEKYSKYIISM